MNFTKVNIVSNGARTPLGPAVAPSAAAVRAALRAAVEHPFMISLLGEPIVGALEPGLDPKLMGPKRLLALAETAIGEACRPLELAGASRPRLALHLALPEIRPGFTTQDVDAIRAGIEQNEELASHISRVNVFPQGHAAGILALEAGAKQIEQGAAEACLVGGIDSYFHPDTLSWLDENRQLAGGASRAGFIPGEGSGFCLLANDRVRDQLRCRSSLRLRTVALGNESQLIKTEENCLGEGLSLAVKEAVGGLRTPDERINAIYCDINGERYRATEWAFVCLRLSRYFDDPTGYVSPAECWGDTGAASIPLFAMLACEAAGRGYSRGPRSLLWASSEAGRRGAVVLEASDQS